MPAASPQSPSPDIFPETAEYLQNGPAPYAAPPGNPAYAPESLLPHWQSTAVRKPRPPYPSPRSSHPGSHRNYTPFRWVPDTAPQIK